MFSHSFKLSDLNCLILQFGEKYELRIENQSFTHLCEVYNNRKQFIVNEPVVKSDKKSQCIEPPKHQLGLDLSGITFKKEEKNKIENQKQNETKDVLTNFSIKTEKISFSSMNKFSTKGSKIEKNDKSEKNKNILADNKINESKGNNENLNIFDIGIDNKVGNEVENDPKILNKNADIDFFNNPITEDKLEKKASGIDFIDLISQKEKSMSENKLENIDDLFKKIKPTIDINVNKTLNSDKNNIIIEDFSNIFEMNKDIKDSCNINTNNKNNIDIFDFNTSNNNHETDIFNKNNNGNIVLKNKNNDNINFDIFDRSVKIENNSDNLDFFNDNTKNDALKETKKDENNVKNPYGGFDPFFEISNENKKIDTSKNDIFLVDIKSSNSTKTNKINEELKLEDIFQTQNIVGNNNENFQSIEKKKTNIPNELFDFLK